jgi:predicted Zn finger-like uncharacterized protein
MSLVTRCTSCGTLFKVVADQLKISDGWVRCGQCATVFDAQANLVDMQTVPPPAPDVPIVTSAPAPMPAPDAFQNAEPVETPAPAAHPKQSKSFAPDASRDNVFSRRDREALLAAFEPYRTSSSSPPGTFSGSVNPSPMSSAPSSMPGEGPPSTPLLAESSNEADTLDSASFRPGQLRGSDDVESEIGPSTSTWASSEYDARVANAAVSFSAEPTTLHPPSSINAALLPESDLSAPSTSPHMQMPTPGFVKQAQRARLWRSPWARFGLGMLGFALIAVLTLQIALHEKDRLAAQWPQTKPWLEQLCLQAGCQVQDLKRIDSIAVDSSSFNRMNKNNPQLEAITQSYRLAVTLKNAGALPVALPHVELSLQDQQDQTILRRVLSPADLGTSLSALAPAQDMAGSTTLQIDMAQLAGSKIQGYRVLAFYP